MPKIDDVHCGFCSRKASDLPAIVAGAKAQICVDCIITCLKFLQNKFPDLILLKMDFTINQDFMAPKLDQCSKCHGLKGGTPGKENVMPDGKLLCDYCITDNVCACGHGLNDHVKGNYSDSQCSKCGCVEYREFK